MTHYKPGLHILCTFSAAASLLGDESFCHKLFDTIIADLQLVKVGEVYHTFEGGGYTAAVALTESHVSIHTWPEFGIATFDVFLSSFLRDNADRAQAFFDAAIAGFGATVVSRNNVVR